MRAIRYTAAGGVVVDVSPQDETGDRVLILRRPGRNEVRLPKGHVEKGESAQETALREVTEESGYADLEIVADLGHQVVEFSHLGAHVVRDERYFLMRLRSVEGASPRQIERQPKELQFIPDWLGWDDALSALTFEAEREWLRRARTTASRPSS